MPEYSSDFVESRNINGKTVVIPIFDVPIQSPSKRKVIITELVPIIIGLGLGVASPWLTTFVPVWLLALIIGVLVTGALTSGAIWSDLIFHGQRTRRETYVKVRERERELFDKIRIEIEKLIKESNS